MRIVEAAGWYFPSSMGGTEIYVAELSRRLRAAGHEVHVAAPDPQTTLAWQYAHEGIPVFRYPIPPLATRDEAQGRVVARGAEVFHDWLARLRPDVVHVHTFVTGLGAQEVRAARAAGARVVVTSHSAALGFTCQRGSLMRWGRRLCDGHVRPSTCAACALAARRVPRPAARLLGLVPPSLGARARALPGRLGTAAGMTELIAFNQATQRRLFDDIEHFVVLTDWARRALVVNGAPPHKVVLSRLGIRFPPGAPRTRRPAGPVTVAYIGRFDPIKGIADFARAIARVPRGQSIRFEFHGPVRHRVELGVLDTIKRIVGPDAPVTFGGELDTDGVRAQLRRIDVLCSPSRVVEGGPTIALEALAEGVPVIGTDIPGLNEIVRHGESGYLVPPGDYRALARGLRAIAASPDLIDRWRGALPPVRTMDDVAGDYLALFEGRAVREG